MAEATSASVAAVRRFAAKGMSHDGKGRPVVSGAIACDAGASRPHASGRCRPGVARPANAIPWSGEGVHRGPGDDDPPPGPGEAVAREAGRDRHHRPMRSHAAGPILRDVVSHDDGVRATGGVIDSGGP